MLSGVGSPLALEATGVLPDAIAGPDPDAEIRSAMTHDPRETMARLETLIHPRVNEDDVTILLVTRTSDDGGASG